MLYAAADGELEVLRYMANEGIDLTLADYDSRTALHLACAENNYNVAFFLLQMGIDPEPRDRWSNTPLSEIEDSLQDRDSMPLTRFQIPQLCVLQLSYGGATGEPVAIV